MLGMIATLDRAAEICDQHASAEGIAQRIRAKIVDTTDIHNKEAK